MPSFFIPLSGLNADSTALNTIANNLSNMNTTGFKSQSVNFSDLFYQQIGSTGSGDAVQLGSGTQVSNIETNFSNGSPNSTGVDTDVALQGNGFFVVSNGSNNLLTRAGNFQTDSSGNLITSNGLSVMGFPALNGVVKTNGSLTAMNIPKNQVEPPKATTSFGMNAILDSRSAVGSSTSGAVPVYDSLGNSYQATVTYTKTGPNAWSYSISIPDNLPVTPATAAAAATLPVGVKPVPTSVLASITPLAPAVTTIPSTLTATTSTSGGTGIQTSYTFGSYTDPTTQVTTAATVDPATNLQITGPTTAGLTATFPATANLATFVSLLPQPVSVTAYATALQNGLNAAGVTGVTVTPNAATGQVLITGPATMGTTGGVTQDMQGTTNVYGFNSNGTVAPATNLTITGVTAAGTPATIVAPTITAGESVAAYATDLTAALGKAGITNTTVSGANNQLSIVGANMSLNGSVNQDLADTAINYNFGQSATVNPATDLTITGPKVGGGMATITRPPITAGETVDQYASDLNAALVTAGIVTGTKGVSVTAIGGQLSIVGPASTLSTAGTASQDLTAQTVSYNFGTSGGTVATVDPTTNFTVTGLTSSGGTATIAAPTVAAGETVAAYAGALQTEISAAGIAGVNVTSANGTLNITGANMSTSGNVVQSAVASSGANGTLTFDSSGNLVSPATDVSQVSFSGLSDGAAPMTMNWNLFGANGAGDISQVAQTSVTSNYVQDGYASGQYSTFSIGSDGTISAEFSNGQTQVVGQLALADVANLQGLTDLGNGDYASTLASGTPSIGTSGSNGLGTMEDSALEGSNVNISAEFANLIIAQRAFEANSKAVTTFDTVTQETINMIH
jgi:flagellar hook protein FlgE